jgi:hypothetical protein
MPVRIKALPPIEKRTTAPASKVLTARGAALEKIILEALAKVIQHNRPAFPKENTRTPITTRVLNEVNARIKALGPKKAKKELGRTKVGRPCVRGHLTTYWQQNPNLAPPK